MKNVILFACLALFVLLLGCGPGSDTSAPVETSPADMVKQSLQSVVEGGDLGSGEETVRSSIEKLKATDAAKADELSADLDELVTLQGDAAKKKAQEMIDKL